MPKLTRGYPLTKRDKLAKDNDFLKRVFGNRHLDDDVRTVIVDLVAKYHDECYGDINEIMYAASETSAFIRLDNYKYLLDRLKGSVSDKMEHAEFIHYLYSQDSELACHLRKAPAAIRRRALVQVRLSRDLSNMSALADHLQVANGDYYSEVPRPVIDLGMKHYSRLDQMIEIIRENQSVRLAELDALLDESNSTSLTAGVL